MFHWSFARGYCMQVLACETMTTFAAILSAGIDVSTFRVVSTCLMARVEQNLFSKIVVVLSHSANDIRPPIEKRLFCSCQETCRSVLYRLSVSYHYNSYLDYENHDRTADRTCDIWLRILVNDMATLCSMWSMKIVEGVISNRVITCLDQMWISTMYDFIEAVKRVASSWARCGFDHVRVVNRRDCIVHEIKRVSFTLSGDNSRQLHVVTRQECVYDVPSFIFNQASHTKARTHSWRDKMYISWAIGYPGVDELRMGTWSHTSCCLWTKNNSVNCGQWRCKNGMYAKGERSMNVW